MTVLAVLGWLAAVILAAIVLRHRCAEPAPVDQALTHLVMVDRAGCPESVRVLKGAPPQELTRAHGRAAATRYRRVGTAALYQVQG